MLSVNPTRRRLIASCGSGCEVHLIESTTLSHTHWTNERYRPRQARRSADDRGRHESKKRRSRIYPGIFFRAVGASVRDGNRGPHHDPRCDRTWRGDVWFSASPGLVCQRRLGRCCSEQQQQTRLRTRDTSKAGNFNGIGPAV